MVLSGIPTSIFPLLTVTLEVQVRGRGRAQREICGRRQMAVGGITRGQGINPKSFSLYAFNIPSIDKSFPNLTAKVQANPASLGPLSAGGHVQDLR